MEYHHCNNCMAMKITFAADILVDGAWVRVTDEKIVEPDLTVKAPAVPGKIDP